MTETRELLALIRDRSPNDQLQFIESLITTLAKQVEVAQAALSHETERADLLRRQAEQWAQEARTHKSSLHEAYQIVTGGKGEPGNWNGAEPIREAFAALTAERDALAERVRVLEGALRACRVWMPVAGQDPVIDAAMRSADAALSPSPLVEGEQ